MDNPGKALSISESKKHEFQTYIVFVLYDLMIMKVKSSDKGSQKGSVSYNGMRPRNPFARK